MSPSKSSKELAQSEHRVEVTSRKKLAFQSVETKPIVVEDCVESNKYGLNHNTTDYYHTNKVYILEYKMAACHSLYLHGASTWCFHNIP
jgi:hypothetical protein